MLYFLTNLRAGFLLRNSRIAITRLDQSAESDLNIVITYRTSFGIMRKAEGSTDASVRNISRYLKAPLLPTHNISATRYHGIYI